MEETNKECVQLWQNRFIGMHQERSVLGCAPCLHRISFFGRAMRPGCQVTSVALKKTLKLYKLKFFLCTLMKNFQNIESKFTFSRKRRNVTKCHCLIPKSNLAIRAHFETWLIINTIPRNICMSFTKCVGVVEKLAFMFMLAIATCTQSWSDTFIAEVSR